MFLGIALFETLNEAGDLNTYIMSPPDKGFPLIVDDLRDVDRRAAGSGVDVGPLRVYAEQRGISFRYVSSRLAGRTFEKRGEQITVAFDHREIPLTPNHAGYYGILFPKGYAGDVSLSIWVAGDEQGCSARSVFLTDTEQLFMSSDYCVYYERPGTPLIRVQARLTRGDSCGAHVERSTFVESFGGYIHGLHDTSIAAFIREINHSLSPDVPQAFICHSNTDKRFARRLAHALSGQGIRVWIDEAEIGPGDSLIEKIESGILSSNNLIVVMTPRSVDSRWCKEELRMALAMQIGGEPIKVLPTLFEDCAIPGFLREKVYVDFRAEEDFPNGIAALVTAVRSTS